MKQIISELDVKSDKGKVRDINEDSFIIINNTVNDSIGAIAVVADGLGGENAGEIASTLAVKSVSNYFDSVSNQDITAAKIQGHLKKSILSAHKKVIEHTLMHSGTRGMATTLAVAWIRENRLYVSWVGDSRCYCYSNDKGLEQLTHDHSYVQQLIDSGELTKDEAAFHPLGHIITQSVGNENNKPEPGFIKRKLYKGDVILLCSDGLTNMLPDAEIADIIKKNPDDIHLCNQILIAAANKAGGIDNITTILMKVTGNTENHYSKMISDIKHAEIFNKGKKWLNRKHDEM